MRITETVAVRVRAAGSGATLSGNKWTPAKDAAGLVEQREWDGLPLNTFIDWMGTSLESQLLPPYGAAAGYQDPGVSRIADHYDGFTGMGFDDEKGKCYHFGGGHAGSANNMLSCFDAAKGQHSIIIPPTHQAKYPPGYSTAGAQNLSFVYYPNYTNIEREYNYFPKAETPAGDDAPCASHEWGGIVFVPGINEVLLPRFGWFHAMLGSRAWRAGPQTTESNRKGFKNRGGIAFQSHHLPSTGLVYMTSEGAQISENAGYFNIVKYDPVARKEVGSMSFDAATWESSSCLVGDTLWRFASDNGGSVITFDLKNERQIRPRTPYGGLKPGWTEGANPVVYVPELDKILMFVTVGGQAGEVLEFDRVELAFKPYIPLLAFRPPQIQNMNNKMRYWPAKKVMLFQLRTSKNCWVLKLA